MELASHDAALNRRGNLGGFPLPSLVSRVQPLLKKVLLVDRLNAAYAEAKAGTEGGEVFRRMLDAARVSYDVDPRDLAKIPPAGPVVAVANHPFGIVEGAILASLLSRVRSDVRIMTNFLVSSIAAVEPVDLFLWVDPFGGPNSVLANRRPLRAAVDWVRQGGMLVAFPAGEVAHFDLRSRRVVDRAWNRSISGLIRLSQASALPVFFHGANSVPFHLAGLLHPSLRTLCLAREFFNKRGRRIPVRVGDEIPFQRLAKFSDDCEMTDYLYRRTFLLANRAEASPSRSLPRRLPPIAAPEDSATLAAEVARLSPDEELAALSGYAVYCARASRVPALLREIGRLREISFRAVGEGVGRPADLDSFDTDYEHLFLWNRERNEVVGAYRIAPVDRIVADRGLSGLYTSTLFEFRPDFFRKLGPAVELGRSFVRPEYQRSFAPLMMLWKGVCAWLVRHPAYHVLFGAVSISDNYCAASRQYMVQFLRTRCLSSELAGLVRARSGFKLTPPRDWEVHLNSNFVNDIEDLSSLITDLEHDRKGVPILVRQYLKLGGRLIDFNLDPDFSRALDGLIVVDLLKTDRCILERYMGKDNATRFFLHHLSPAGGHTQTQPG
ncbi:MAG: lysophospholipid acyltransferase family protein [Bryobacteraceae bacterium]|nr:lysophospholipid acyltransferase family protein [Bryobacteraceae bacterium]